MKEKTTGFFGEFKQFIARGNVMDMAVGVIIGGAFSSITTSLINDIIMPLLGIFTRSITFSALSVTVGAPSSPTVTLSRPSSTSWSWPLWCSAW